MNSPQRLIVYSPQFHTHRGGAEKYTAWLARGLLDKGYDVSIVCNKNERKSEAYALDTAIRVHEVDNSDRNTAVRELRAQLQANRADVVVAIYSDAHLLIAILAAAPLGIPVVASEHAHPSFIEGHAWNRPDRLAALLAAAHIHVIDAQTTSSLPPPLREKSFVIANPVPPAQQFAQPNAASPTKRLISLGRLDPVKQFDLLIEAFATVHGDHHDWTLEIWGEGQEKNRLFRLIQKLGMEKNIFLRGFTDNITPVLASGHCFCLPSRSEIFGLALGEAMAHGLPSVGFASTTGVNQLITHEKNGLLAEETSAAGLATCLRTLFSSAELRATIGAEARKTAELYCPELLLEQWDSLLRQSAGVKRETVEPLDEYTLAYARLQDYLARDNPLSPEALQKALAKIHRSRTWRCIMWLRKIRSRLNILKRFKKTS